MIAKSKILFLGDVLLDRQWSISIPEGQPIVFNLEGPISETGSPIPAKINLRSSRNWLDSLLGQPTVAVCLANNHIMDYGNAAFEDTLEFLANRKVPFFGSGNRENNYNNPVVIEVAGFKIGMAGYCQIPYYENETDTEGLLYRPAPADEGLIMSDIRYLQARGVDRILLQFHWGREESSLPIVDQIRIGRLSMEMGADSVIGHHSHTVQPVERYKHGLIAYSLGNFMFPDLDVLSYYDCSGRQGRRVVKKPYPWNRSALGLLLNVATMEYEIQPLYYDGYKVAKKHTYYHRYADRSIPSDWYELEKLVWRHRQFRNLIILFMNFVRNPKMPRSSTLLEFTKTIMRFVFSEKKGLN